MLQPYSFPARVTDDRVGSTFACGRNAHLQRCRLWSRALCPFVLLFILVGCGAGRQESSARITRVISPCETVRDELDAVVTAVRKGRGEVAENQLKKAVARAPVCARAHLLLAMVLREKGKLTSALEEANEAARLAPGDAVILNLIGNIHAAMAASTGNPQEALEELTIARITYAAAINIGNPDIQFSSMIGLLGIYLEQERLLRRIGKHTEADVLRAEIQAFIKDNPRTSKTLEIYELRNPTAVPVRVDDPMHPKPGKRTERLRQTLEGTK